MLTDTELSFSYWDLFKSQYEEADAYPFASPVLVFSILACYLLFTLKIGPSYMKNKEPYKLTSILLLYNAAQVYFSLYLFKKSGKQMFAQGLAPKTCIFNDETHRKETLSIAYLYYIAKITELLDTVFFVLRKKHNQISFLHVYHHFTMLFGSWAFFKFWNSEAANFGIVINSLIHVLMYIYYGLAALGPKVTKYIFWKKHITKMQLMQFVCVFFNYIISRKISECPSTLGADAYYLSTNVAFMILFLNFYFKSYVKNKSTSNGVSKLAGKDS